MSLPPAAEEHRGLDEPGVAHGAELGIAAALASLSAPPRSERWVSRSRLVEVEKEVVCGAHDLGVLPLGGPVVAGDHAHAVQATKVAEHKGIAAFRLVRCTIGEREVPGRVLRPTMSLEERVLLGRPWLDVSPPAAHPILMGVDQVP